MRLRVTAAGRTFEVEVEHGRLVRVDGSPVYVDLEQIDPLPLYALTLDDAGYVLFVKEQEGSYQVEVQGNRYAVDVQRAVLGPLPPPSGPHSQGNGRQTIVAPLPGRLAAVPVSEGDRLEAGQVVAVVESMKMQMELRASQAGEVDVVHGTPGRDVAAGEALVTLRMT